MTGEPPYSELDGISLGRAALDKVFTGPLAGTGKGQMLAARTPIPDSAGYVALERFEGVLEGRQGSFVLLHNGVMTRGARSLTVTIVPDSGTGGLAGIAGRMDIQIVDGKHYYELDYTLPG